MPESNGFRMAMLLGFMIVAGIVFSMIGHDIVPFFHTIQTGYDQRIPHF